VVNPSIDSMHRLKKPPWALLAASLQAGTWRSMRRSPSCTSPLSSVGLAMNPLPVQSQLFLPWNFRQSRSWTSNVPCSRRCRRCVAAPPLRRGPTGAGGSAERSAVRAAASPPLCCPLQVREALEHLQDPAVQEAREKHLEAVSQAQVAPGSAPPCRASCQRLWVPSHGWPAALAANRRTRARAALT
jgi:hypothetical protein